MKLTDKSTALMRIIRAIKSYCYQTADYRDPADNASIGLYLKQHLSIQNWKFWQRLQPNERASFVNNQDSLPNDALTLQQFQLRLKQYKRAGYELFAFWHQAQVTPLAESRIKGEKAAMK